MRLIATEVLFSNLLSRLCHLTQDSPVEILTSIGLIRLEVEFNFSPQGAVMSGNSSLVPSDLLADLISAIADVSPRHIYLEVITGRRGLVQIRQIEFLSVEDFARLVRVEPRTVHGWIQRGIAPTPYRPPGSRGILFDLNEAIAWIKNNPVPSDK